MKNKLLLILLAICFFCSYEIKAEIIDLNSAHEIAKRFTLNSKQTRGNSFNKVSLEHTVFTPHKKDPALYIFNYEDGGFVIVSAETLCDHEILAYSNSGSFKYEKCNPAVKEIIDKYSNQIESIRQNPVTTTRSVGNILDGDQSVDFPDEVAPLIKTKWNQMEPYNDLCPELQGYKLPTGCVATAMAQIMYYHQWPEKGEGEYSYTWNGQTLSRDFSQSEYNWDKMLLNYDDNYTQEEVDAVASLMYDIGIAFEMDYNLSGSGTTIYFDRLHDFFGYDLGVCIANQQFCSQQDWINLLKNEIADGYPVPYSNNVHTFICDGYDEQDYFHFNFGWGGGADGYYLIDVSNDNPYIGRREASIHIRIQKDRGGLGRQFVFSNGDFISLENNILRLPIVIETWGGVESNLYIKAEEINSHNIYYQEIYNNIDNLYTFDIDLPDGHYTLTPIVREQNSDKDIKVHFAERFQSSVDLMIKNGEYIYSNLTYIDLPKEGTVELGGIYYELDDENLTATVTYKNENYNCYSGEVIVPDYIENSDKKYSVEVIGKFAFKQCPDLKKVVLGKNIKEIQFDAFNKATSLEYINLDNCIDLQILGNAVFSGCYELKSIELPDNLISIDGWCFSSCFALESVKFPKKLKELGNNAFANCSNLKQIILPIAKPIEAEELFYNLDPENVKEIKVYVPVGSKSSYKNSPTWGNCEIIDNIEIAEVEAKQILLNLDKVTLNIGDSTQLEATVLPEDTTDTTITWGSSDEKIALVSQTGFVMAISSGSAIITASCGPVSADCVVTVPEDAGIESLWVDPDNQISVYTTDGILIKRNCKVEDLKTLNKGIYIIVSGKDRYKISI